MALNAMQTTSQTQQTPPANPTVHSLLPPPRARRKRRAKITPLPIPRDPDTLRHPICTVLARILHEARLAWGYSRYELGKLSGVSSGMIKKIERLICVPTVEVLVRLCTALRLYLSDLFGQVDCIWQAY